MNYYELYFSWMTIWFWTFQLQVKSHTLVPGGAQTCGRTGNAITRRPMLPWSARYTAAPKGCNLYVLFLAVFAFLHAAVHEPQMSFFCTSGQTRDSEGMGNNMKQLVKHAHAFGGSERTWNRLVSGRLVPNTWLKFLKFQTCRLDRISVYLHLSDPSVLLLFCSSLNVRHNLDMERPGCAHFRRSSSTMICRPVVPCHRYATVSIDFRSLAAQAWKEHEFQAVVLSDSYG